MDPGQPKHLSSKIFEVRGYGPWDLWGLIGPGQLIFNFLGLGCVCVS